MKLQFIVLLMKGNDREALRVERNRRDTAVATRSDIDAMLASRASREVRTGPATKKPPTPSCDGHESIKEVRRRQTPFQTAGCRGADTSLSRAMN